MAVARGDTEWADVAVAAIFPYAGVPAEIRLAFVVPTF